MTPPEVSRPAVTVAGRAAVDRSGRRSHTPGQAVAKQARRLDLRLLVPVVVAWPLTAFVALVAPLRVVLAGSALAALTAVVLLRRRGRRRPSARLIALSLAAVALCGTAAVGHRAVQSVGPLEALAHDAAVVTLRGSVASELRLVAGRSRVDGEPGDQQVVVRVDVTQVSGRGEPTTIGTPVLVRGDIAWRDVRWRSEVEFSGRLRPAEEGDDVVAVVTARGTPQVRSPPGPAFVAADVVRERFREATAHLPADARGLVPALVIGDTSSTPPDLTEAMLETGMSHLSAVSGSNVTLVLAAALGLAQLLLLPRRLRPWVALLVLLGFVILARPEPSVIRAAVMGAVGLLGLSLERRRMGIPALAGAMLALLVWDPWLSRSYGFALSSMATLGLLVLAQPWGAAISRRLPPRLTWLGPVIAVPVAAQVVCAPIVVSFRCKPPCPWWRYLPTCSPPPSSHRPRSWASPLP